MRLRLATQEREGNQAKSFRFAKFRSRQEGINRGWRKAHAKSSGRAICGGGGGGGGRRFAIIRVVQRTRRDQKKNVNSAATI